MDPELFGDSPQQPDLSGMTSVAQDANFSGTDSSGNSLSLGNLLSFGGSAMGAVGDLMAGSETASEDNYNAQLALTQGQFDVDDLDTQEADTLSTQKAQYAKAGVTLSGSPLDTAFNTASQFEMDKQIATYNATSKANMDEYLGKVAQSRGDVAAGEALLSGAGKLAMSEGFGI